MSVLLEKLDLVVFLVVVALAAVLAVGGVGTGAAVADPALDEGQAAREELEGALRGDDFERRPEAADLARHAQRLESLRAAWGPAPRVEALEEGLVYHPEALSDLREGRELEIRFYGPRSVEVDPQVGFIRVRWAPHGLSTVPVDAFLVYRKTGESDAKVVATLGPEEREYVDRAVSPGQLYSYEIAARSDDEKLVELGQEISPRSRAAHARARRDYELELLDADLEAEKARIRIRKFDDGTWHEKEFDVAKGQALGVVDPGSGIDYRTNSTFVGLDRAIERKPETREEVVFDAEGRVVFDAEGRPKRREATVVREREILTLEYENELGQKEKLVLKR